jgi:hypothetical protein
MSKPLEFTLWKNYGIAIRDWLAQNIYLSNLTNQNNINIVYDSIDRAWVNQAMQIVNGQNSTGSINFVLTETEYLENENILGFTHETKVQPSGKVNIVRPPLVYGLTYRMTVFTRLQSEMDYLLYQILSKAHKHAKAVVYVDGQFCEFSATNPTDETNLEPGDIQDRIVRFGLNLKVKRAYLPLLYTEAEKITSVNTNIDSNQQPPAGG